MTNNEVMVFSKNEAVGHISENLTSLGIAIGCNPNEMHVQMENWIKKVGKHVHGNSKGEDQFCSSGA